MNNSKILVTILVIAFFRILDLISTHYALLGQDNLENELNLLVQFFNIKSKGVFYTMESVGIILLCGVFLFYVKNKNVLRIKGDSLKNYSSLLFYGKKKVPFLEFLIKPSIKNSFVIIGKIVPAFTVFSSLLYIINNILVYKANNELYYNKLYYSINRVINFEYIIYVLPIILFVSLLVYALNKNYKRYQI